MDRLRMRARGSTVGMWCALALTGAGLVACSSDDFGMVGGSLPIDVSQDSILVEMPPLDLLEVKSVIPPLAQAASDRELLVLGNRPLGGWRATPLLRFDLSAGIPDTVLTAPEQITAAALEFEMVQADANKGFLRQVRVDALADTLRAIDAEAAAVEPLLGETLTTKDFDLSSPRFVIELPPAVAWQWLQDRDHRGVALYDLTPDARPENAPYGSNFVGLASREMRTFSLLQQLGAGETAIPELKVTVGGQTFSFVPLLDLTVVQRDTPADDALVIGAYAPSRPWLRFDLASGVIPGNATINRALLTVVVDSTGTIGERDRTTLAYEARATELDVAVPPSNAAVLRSAGTVAFTGEITAPQEVVVDLTDFVQRAVNLVVPAEAGILLRLTDGEFLRMDVATFFGPSAPEDLRPRLIVTFTPPADTWR
jgi:hypothetical protein